MGSDRRRSFSTYKTFSEESQVSHGHKVIIMKFTRKKEGSGYRGTMPSYVIEMSRITGESIRLHLVKLIKEMNINNKSHCLVLLEKGLGLLKGMDAGSFEVED